MQGTVEIVIEEPTIIDLILQYSGEYNIDTEIPLAIAEAESDFRDVCNTGGCRYGIGPFQVVQTTFDTYCEGRGSPVMEDVYDKNDNIQCAINMLSKKRYSHWYKYSGDEWFPTLSPKAQREVFTYVIPKCTCVEYVRKLSDFQPAKVINAIDIPATRSEPIPGAWILFDYNHVGFVWAVGENTLTYNDRQLTKDGECIIATKTISLDHDSIRGYFW